MTWPLLAKMSQRGSRCAHLEPEKARLQSQFNLRKSRQPSCSGKESQPDWEQRHQHRKQNDGKQAGDDTQDGWRNGVDETQEWKLLSEEIDIRDETNDCDGDGPVPAQVSKVTFNSCRKMSIEPSVSRPLDGAAMGNITYQK